MGLLIGLLVTQFNLSSFIVTLGLWGAVRGLAKRLAGGSEISTQPSWISHLLQMLPPGQKWMIVPPGVWLLLVLSVFVAAVLRYTRFGRHVFAIGSNEQTARLCGVPVDQNQAAHFRLRDRLRRDRRRAPVFLSEQPRRPHHRQRI